MVIPRCGCHRKVRHEQLLSEDSGRQRFPTPLTLHLNPSTTGNAGKR